MAIQKKKSGLTAETLHQRWEGRFSVEQINEAIGKVGLDAVDEHSAQYVLDYLNTQPTSEVKPEVGKLAKTVKPSGELTRKTLERKAKPVEETPIDIPTVEPVQIQRDSVVVQWVDGGNQLAVAAQQTLDALAFNEAAASKVNQLQEVVNDDLVIKMLAGRISEVMEVFGLTTQDEVFEGTAADRRDLWEKFVAYKREQIERTEATINQLLSFDPVARYRSAANA